MSQVAPNAAGSPIDGVDQLGGGVEVDRLAALRGPARQDHHRQPAHQTGQDLERRAVRPDHEARAERGDRHAVRAERGLDLAPAREVRGQLGVVRGRDQAPEVDDLLDAGLGGGAADVVGADQVEVLEPALHQPRGRQHRVHQVRDVARPDQRLLDVLEREQITRDQPVPRAGGARAPAGQARDREPVGGAPGEPAGHGLADKSGGAGDHDRGGRHVAVARVAPPTWMQSTAAALRGRQSLRPEPAPATHRRIRAGPLARGPRALSR